MVKILGAAVLFAAASAFAGCTLERGREVPASSATDAEGKALRVSPEGVEASEPAIAAGTDGRVFVAYVQKSGEAGDLFVRAYDPGKGELGEPVRVNPTPGQARTWYGDPPTIAVAPSGAMHVGWTAKYPDGARGTMLFMSVSRDGGRTFEEPVRVDDDPEPASHGMHSMAIGADGRVHFAWLDERYLRTKKRAARRSGHSPVLAFFNHTPIPEREPNAELYFATSSEDGRSFGRNLRVEGDVCPCCKTSVLVSPGGRVLIGYRKVFPGEMRHIAVSRSWDGGATFEGPVQVSDDRWHIEACPVSGPAMRADGEAVRIAWFAGGEAEPKGIYTSQTVDDGATFAPRALVAETDAGGSPAWAGAGLLWSAEARIGMWNAGGTSMLAEGRSVVATDANGRACYAFVSTEGERKSVRLGVE